MLKVVKVFIQLKIVITEKLGLPLEDSWLFKKQPTNNLWHLINMKIFAKGVLKMNVFYSINGNVHYLNPIVT